ncbi:MAG: YCF48-related protein, partial [Pyrinomonadaceae bacterium]
TGVVIGDQGTILRTTDGAASWTKITTKIRENLYGLSFYDQKNGFAVGSAGITLRTVDGGVTWQDQESASKFNLFAVQAFGPQAAIAVGELGTILITEDGGKTWAIQPSITSKVLQAIVYRGGNRVWVAGRGGTMLKRTESLSPRTLTVPKNPPVLKSAPPRAKPKARTPLVTITDDGDIPTAVPVIKPN